MLRHCVDVPLAELCDQVLKRLFLPDSEDDVAVLAVRLHPQAGRVPRGRAAGGPGQPRALARDRARGGNGPLTAGR